MKNPINAMTCSIDDCHGDELFVELDENEPAERVDDFLTDDSVENLDRFFEMFDDDAHLLMLVKKASAWPTDSNSVLYESNIIELFEYVREKAKNNIYK